LSSVSRPIAASVSRTSAVSVISSRSASGGRPLFESASRTWSTSAGVSSWRIDTFTAIDSVWPWVCHSAACRHASPSTQRPTSAIRPVSSSMGMNSFGPTTPRTGWCQRSSASTP